MMPISAPGNSRPTRPRANGFTLVELLAVLAIIGASSAAVLLSLPDRADGLRNQAERLAARLRAAHTEAVVRGHSVALIAALDRYGFAAHRHGQWQPITERPFAIQPLDPGTQLACQPSCRLRFAPTGGNDPALLTLQQGDTRISLRIDFDGTIHVGG